jgi:hypothetical protein
MPSASTIVALTETERHGFDIQEGAHKMVDQMRKWFSYDDDAQITHVRKIRLGAFARGMNLLKDQLVFRLMQFAPSGDMLALPHNLVGPVAVGMLLDEQGRGVLRGITLELGHHPLPILLKGILPGQLDAGQLELRGQCSHLLILAPRSLAHSRRGELLPLAWFACCKDC